MISIPSPITDGHFNPDGILNKRMPLVPSSRLVVRHVCGRYPSSSSSICSVYAPFLSPYASTSTPMMPSGSRRQMLPLESFNQLMNVSGFGSGFPLPVYSFGGGHFAFAGSGNTPRQPASMYVVAASL